MFKLSYLCILTLSNKLLLAKRDKWTFQCCHLSLRVDWVYYLVLSLSSFYYCDKIQPKNNLKRRVFLLLLLLCFVFHLGDYSPSPEVREGNQGRGEKATYWLVSHGFLSLLSCTSQDHSELCTRTSITNLENYPLTCLQVSLMRQFLNRDSFFSNMFRFVSS